MKQFITLLILLSFMLILVSCGGVNISPNSEESKLIIDEEHSLITIYALFKNENRKTIGPLYAKFIIYDETLQEAIGAEVINFTNENGKKQPFSIGGNDTYFISETFQYNVELDNEELVNQVEVVISDENEMELVQFVIPNIVKSSQGVRPSS